MEHVTTLRLDLQTRAQLVCAARDAAPEEACGLLAGRHFGAEIIVSGVPSARNVAARPELEFRLDPGEVVALHDAALRDGTVIVGTWHSHVHGEATPSRADLDSAWPGHVVVITAREAVRAFVVEGGRPRELALAPDAAPCTKARDGDDIGG